MTYRSGVVASAGSTGVDGAGACELVDCGDGRKVRVTAPATSEAITAKRKAPSETCSASASEAGSPTIATRIAVPRTAPTWRKAALTALACRTV